MDKDKIFPQKRDKLDMRVVAAEARMRGDAIRFDDG